MFIFHPKSHSGFNTEFERYKTDDWTHHLVRHPSVLCDKGSLIFCVDSRNDYNYFILSDFVKNGWWRSYPWQEITHGIRFMKDFRSSLEDRTAWVHLKLQFSFLTSPPISTKGHILSYPVGFYVSEKQSTLYDQYPRLCVFIAAGEMDRRRDIFYRALTFLKARELLLYDVCLLSLHSTSSVQSEIQKSCHFSTFSTGKKVGITAKNRFPWDFILFHEC